MDIQNVLAQHRLWLGGFGGRQANLTKADLREANLIRANLTKADLREANLTRAYLRMAALTKADLTMAVLIGADLREASLARADLTLANLTEADLTWANLTEANLTNANLTGANLTNANLSETVMPSPEAPRSLLHAAVLTLDWLRGRWIQKQWIETPNGAYSGNCRACLHGAAAYVGGSFGPELSRRLVDLGYDSSWNDNPNRTEEEVLEALNKIANLG